MYDDWQPPMNNNNQGNRFNNRNDDRKGYYRQQRPRFYGNGNNGNSNGNGNGNANGNSHGGNRENNSNGNIATQDNPSMGSSPSVEMILKEEAYNVVGCAINILNEIGPGLPAESYEKAMRVEFNLKEIPYLEDQNFDIFYKEVKVADFQADMIAYESIMVDIKIIDSITDMEVARMVNYLKSAGLQAGLIFNFKYPKLQWQRVIV